MQSGATTRQRDLGEKQTEIHRASSKSAKTHGRLTRDLKRATTGGTTPTSERGSARVSPTPVHLESERSLKQRYHHSTAFAAQRISFTSGDLTKQRSNGTPSAEHSTVEFKQCDIRREMPRRIPSPERRVAPSSSEVSHITEKGKRMSRDPPPKISCVTNQTNTEKTTRKNTKYPLDKTVTMTMTMTSITRPVSSLNTKL